MTSGKQLGTIVYPQTNRTIVYQDCSWTTPLKNCLSDVFFPTCQVRVVRFYISCLPRPPPHLPPPPPRPPRPPRHPCRPRPPRPPRPTAIRDPHCSVPDLNHDHPRPVFPAGPQPRPSTPSVPCRTSTATIPA